MKDFNEPKLLSDIYGTNKVMTIIDLKNNMKVSEITIHRKLKKSGAITSYNRNGRYYTLPHIPAFDSYGLWNYDDIRFSKYGNLNQTIIGLINQSPGGLHAGAIGELIAYPPHSLLKQLCIKSEVQREKLQGGYVYFSIDEQVYKSQFNSHASIQTQYGDEDMPCMTAVRLLIEKIRRPKDSVSKIVSVLHRENIKISKSQAKRFFEKHGIEKKKNIGFEVACLLRKLFDDTVNNLNLTNVFIQPPVFYFKTTKVLCLECQTILNVHHTDTRKVYSLHIGEFNAHRTFMYCPNCNAAYPPEDFSGIVPQYSNVGYDVIVFIGRLIFHDHHTLMETKSVLGSRNIRISTSEVAYLAQKYIFYLSILHQEAGFKLKMQIHQNGGYILHVDGTSEGASPHLISAIDEVSNFVLANVKVPSESIEQVVPFLKEIKEQYGDPLAITSDMGRAFLGAISEVFPDKPNYICHFHFLRDSGKDLLEKEYSIIRSKLKKYGIAAQLRYRLRYYFENKPENINVCQINEIIETTTQININDNRNIKQVCHILLLWALDGKNYGNGLGFPFDRPHGEFYKRLCLLFQKLNCFQKKCSGNKSMTKMIAKITSDLMPLANDNESREASQILSEKEKVFDQLRQALYIALPTTINGLNDNGESVEIDTIENKVNDFKEWLAHEGYYHKNNDYLKLTNQIKKYWDKLFSGPIIIPSPDGGSSIQPQRTNNIIEQFFRGIRRTHRRTTGNNSMCKKLQSMFADTPLVKNLDNPDYMKVILNGGKSLEEKFAEIDYEKIMSKRKEAEKVQTKIPGKVKKLIRQEETMNKLLYLIAV